MFGLITKYNNMTWLYWERVLVGALLSKQRIKEANWKAEMIALRIEESCFHMLFLLLITICYVWCVLNVV